MVRWIAVLALVVTALLAGCSRDNFYAVPNGYQPPPPPTFQPPAPAPSGYPPSSWTPQLPPGYPQQYYPFLPIDNYMRRTPPLQGYWVQFWGAWQQYATNYGYSPYDFNTFWYDFCPQQWQNTSYWPLYQYIDQSFYGWMNPSMQLPSTCDPSYFWGGYNGYPYAGLDAYGYCDGYCYY